MNTLEQKMNDAIWIAKELFDRGKATGSSANLSFLHDGHIYITGSGTCFGNLTTESFSEVSFQGQHLAGINPSKELPLHKLYYEKIGRNPGSHSCPQFLCYHFFLSGPPGQN